MPFQLFECRKWSELSALIMAPDVFTLLCGTDSGRFDLLVKRQAEPSLIDSGFVGTQHTKMSRGHLPRVLYHQVYNVYKCKQNAECPLTTSLWSAITSP